MKRHEMNQNTSNREYTMNCVLTCTNPGTPQGMIVVIEKVMEAISEQQKYPEDNENA